jgi:ribonuclease E
MLDDERTDTTEQPADTPAPRRRTTKKTAAPPAPQDAGSAGPAAPVKRTRKKAAATAAPDAPPDAPSDEGGDAPVKATRSRAKKTAAEGDAQAATAAVVFQAPLATAPPRKRAAKKTAAPPAKLSDADGAIAPAESDKSEPGAAEPAAPVGGEGGERTAGGSRRRRGRRGRGGRGGSGGAGGAGGGAGGGASAGDPVEAPGEEADADLTDAEAAAEAEPAGETDSETDGETDADDAEGGGEPGTAARRRRRRRRRRTSEGGEDTADGESDDDGVETVVHVRQPRPAKTAAKTPAQRAPRAERDQADDDDGVRGVKGSTRIEAKRQRRREGRDTGRRRPPIITEAEFLARRESVDRIMVVRQTGERTQIGVLEDGVLVEHYVARKDQTSMVGNAYLGKVQNVLPSMEAAFVDIGRGRNAVLYAGEVNYDASAIEGRPPRIEQALKSGQSVLVQVTKDPIGHKGARLTSQVSLPGRYMVYVPDGRLSGISRKLPDTERTRLKSILKRLTPEEAGVIIRTAAEGASEEDLERDLNRLHAQWEDIEKKAQTASAPALIYSEPDVVIRVIRDIFNEDFKELVVQGADEWETVDNYVRWVAPDLAERTRRWTDDEDIFAAYRIDEQLAKALDRKVWLPSGGYLVIDRTEAMIVVDVNTGKFTGKGGNLEETVTKNNIEAAEEIVRQLRLRDLGGIIVIDFIDMVLESNRDLVLRRLMECLGRDRTRHQVAEVTSLGLVQMTRKRVGQGLLEAFSETCKECGGRGVILTMDPVATKRPPKPKPIPAPAAPPAATADTTDAAAEPSADGEGPAGEPKPKKRSRGGRGRGTGAKTAADATAVTDGAA